MAKLARDAEAHRRPDNCLRYCVLAWPHHMLIFLDGLNVKRNVTKFEQHHRTELKCPCFVGWQNREFFHEPLEGKRYMYVMTTLSEKYDKPCRALSRASRSVCGYRANKMDNVKKDGMARRLRNLPPLVAIVDRVIMAIILFLKRARP